LEMATAGEINGAALRHSQIPVPFSSSGALPGWLGWKRKISGFISLSFEQGRVRLVRSAPFKFRLVGI